MPRPQPWRARVPLERFQKRRLRPPPEKMLTLEEGVAILRARPSLEKGVYRPEEPTPAGPPPTRGAEKMW
jgi:hypothetical protein